DGIRDKLVTGVQTCALPISLNSEFAITLFGKTLGLWGQKGFLLSSTYDVGVMVVFLFQMVFMDTTLTIVTGTAAERWKYSAFIRSEERRVGIAGRSRRARHR